MERVLPQGFFSYARANDRADDEALTHLHNRLEQEISSRLGYYFTLFQDRRDLATGVAWESTLDNAIESASIFLPMITPHYLRSVACRQEFERFLAREQVLGHQNLIFPLYYLECPELESGSNLPDRSSNRVVTTLRGRQRDDWRSLRLILLTDPDALTVRERIGKVASEIADRFRQLQSEPASARPQLSSGPPPALQQTQTPRHPVFAQSGNTQPSSHAPDPREFVDRTEFARTAADSYDDYFRTVTFRAPFDGLLLPSAMPCVGRTHEVSWLRERLQSEAPLAVVQGMSGIGKSMLVAKVIETLDLGATFPDGLVVLSALAQEVDDRHLLQQLIRRTTTEENFPANASWEYTVKTLQRLFQGRRLLVVFDSLPAALALDRLVPLLQRLHCGVIIITAQIPSTSFLPASYRLALRGLTEDESLLLFRQAYLATKGQNDSAGGVADAPQHQVVSLESPEDQAAIRRITTLVEGHPLAIEVVASYVAAIGLDVIDVAEDLMDAGQVLHLGLGDAPPIVLTVLRKSYDALPRPAQSLFAALAAGNVNELGRGAALALTQGVRRHRHNQTSLAAPTSVAALGAPETGVATDSEALPDGATSAMDVGDLGAHPPMRDPVAAHIPHQIPDQIPDGQDTRRDWAEELSHLRSDRQVPGLAQPFDPILDVLITRSFLLSVVNERMLRGIQRYRLHLHPLLLALAQDCFEKWSQAEQREAHQILARFYATYVGDLGEFMADPATPFRETEAQQAQETLAADLAPIIAALRWVDSDEGVVALDPQAHDAIIEALCGGLQFRWRSAGRYEEAHHWLPLAIAATERRIAELAADPVGLVVRLAHFYFTLALAEIDAGHDQQASTALESCLILRQQSNDLIGQAAVLHQLGQVAESQGRISAARACYEDGLRMVRAAGDRYGEASICLSLGIVDVNTYRLSEAKPSLDRAEHLAKQEGWEHLLLNVLSLQGRRARLLGDLEQAQHIFEDLQRQAERQGDDIGVCRALHELGQVAVKRLCPGDAITLYRQALTIAQDQGSPRWQAIVANALGNAKLALAPLAASVASPHTQQVLLEEAQTFFTQSLHLARVLHDHRMEGTQLTLLGMVAMLQERFDLAEASLVAGLTLAEPAENQDDVGGAFETLGMIALQRRQRVEAQCFLRKSLLPLRQVGHFDEANRVENLLQRFGTLEGTQIPNP